MALNGPYTGEARGMKVPQDWGTPRGLFGALHERFRFDLDGAADPGDELLSDYASDAWVSWVGRRVFCNPPWAAIAPFVEKAAMAECAVLLVPARVNSRWFHRALELGARVEFFLGRPQFGKNGGTGSPYDCLLLIWGA